VHWVQQEHYGLLDINLFPKPPSSDRDVSLASTLFLASSFSPTVSAKNPTAVRARDCDLPLGQLHLVSDTRTRRDSDAFDLPVGGRLSAARRIILIGHGPGVVGISELLEARSELFSPLAFVCAP
jgi:hypothetical protein